jgi:hypothetical protein
MIPILIGLTEAIDDVGTVVPDMLEDPTAHQPQVCELLYALREQRVRLAEIEAIVEAKAARSMGRADRIEWAGYYAERKGGMVRKHWDHKLLAAKVTEYTYTDLNTGAIDETVQSATSEAVGLILRAAAISYWRTTVLRSMGINYDDAVETERGRRTVHVTKGGAP